MSHPVWVRGLKRIRWSICLLCDFVAPRVGAWIETFITKKDNTTAIVAPRVGAWIETSAVSGFCFD